MNALTGKIFLILLLFINAAVFGQDNDVRIWGVSSGSNTNGFIFSMNPDGSDFIRHKTLAGNLDGANPFAKIIKGSDGLYYGVTGAGGTQNRGVIYRVNADGSGYQKIFDMVPSIGANLSEIVEGSDGRLYGFTGIKLFSLNKDGSDFKIIYTLEQDAFLSTPLVDGADGFLYGLVSFTSNSGSVFKVRHDGTEFQRIYNTLAEYTSFNRLMVGRDGMLYWFGNFNKTIHRVTKQGSDHVTLGSFPEAVRTLVQMPDNSFRGIYSANNGTNVALFKIQQDGNGYAPLYSFSMWPNELTLGTNGKLYGIGIKSELQSAVFRIDEDGSNFTLLQSQAGVENGNSGQSIIETSAGNFLATARGGGVSENGIVFTITDGGTFVKRKEFPEQEGTDPRTPLLLSSDGYLYGTTVAGGQYGSGTLFKIRKDGTDFTVLYQFEPIYADATWRGGLIESGGYLFGTTGLHIFRIAKNGTGFIKFNLWYADDNRPFGNLIVGQDGSIYGVKSRPSNSVAAGIVYKINTDLTGYTEILDLSTTHTTTGSFPVGIMQLANGRLVVSTGERGPSSWGSTFSMNTNGTDIFLIKPNTSSEFVRITGNVPVEGSDGLLYGSTYYGEAVNSIKPDGTELVRYNLEGYIAGSLIEVSKKRLLGLNPWSVIKFNMETRKAEYVYIPNGISSTAGPTAVHKNPQTVTLNAIPPKKISDPWFRAVATSSSGSTITYTSSNTAVATISDNNKVTIVGAGTTTIKAYQAGDIITSDASDTKELTVAKVKPVVAMSSFHKGNAGEVIPLQANSGGSDGQLNFTVINGTGSATLTDNKLTLVTPGAVTLKLTVSATTNYDEAIAEQLFTIGQPAPQIVFTSPASGNEGDTVPITLNSGGSTGAVTYVVENITGTASITATALSLTSPGTVRIRATIAADANFSEKTAVQMFTIKNADGTMPAEGPRLVGTTLSGGNRGGGVLYQLQPDFTGYAALADFSFDADGNFPVTSQLLQNGSNILYSTLNGGKYGSGALLKYSATDNIYTIEHNFTELDGQSQTGYLILASDGMMYGLTGTGGANQSGTLFSYDAINKVFTKKADLHGPTTGLGSRAGLVEGAPGFLYGMPQYGGANNGGTIFEYNMATGTITKKVDLPVGVSNTGHLTKAPNGKLYGTTSLGGDNGEGTIFEFDPATGTMAIKVHLDRTGTGVIPLGGLTLAQNGKMYCMPASGPNQAVGSILEYVPGATTATSVYDMSEANGWQPQGNLFSAPDGMLYGLASFGGPEDGGTLFKFDPDTHQFSVRYGFHRATGYQPYGALMASANGKFYGATGFGGAHDGGVLFEFDPGNDQYTVKRDFILSLNGSSPSGKLIFKNNKIYGYTYGGTLGQGTLYEYNESSGVHTKLFDFGEKTGRNPVSLIEGTDGKLLTATTDGFNRFNRGNVIEFDPVTGTSTVRANFQKQTYSVIDMMRASNGKYYLGSRGSLGEIVEFDPATNSVATVFNSLYLVTGEWPQQLTEHDGFIYGITWAGGPGNGGTIFRFDYNQKEFTILHEFSTTDGGGYQPNGKLAFDGNGKLYGLTLFGGQNGKGVLFELNIATKAFTVRKHLERTVGQAGLIVGFNKKLIGVFDRGTTDKGIIFEFDPVTGILENKFVFNGANGSTPGEIFITRSEQHITFKSLPTRSILSEPFNLEATASSGLEVSFTSSNPSVATVEGKVVTIVGLGETIITASQAGDAVYDAAEPVDAVLKVVKADQAITFGPIGAKNMGDNSFNLTANSSSGLPVTYSSTSDRITIGSSKVTITKAGRVTIKAEQSGNDRYNAATPVEQSFCINPLKPAIATTTNIAPSLPRTFGSSSDTGNQWFKDGQLIAGATNSTYTATEDGTYSVQVAIDDCKTMSDDVVFTISGVNEIINNEVRIYPNPAVDETIVRVESGTTSEVHIQLNDVLGREIESRTSFAGRDERFDLSTLNKGVFLFRIKIDNKLVVRKVVKNF